MKTPKQYAEHFSSVDDHGFYSVDIRPEDLERLVAVVQSEALEAAAQAIEALLDRCVRVEDL